MGAKGYTNLGKIGEGGFGEVYKIEKDKKHYALKKSKIKLSEEEINQIIKITDILSKMNSKYIIKYYQTFKEKNSLSIIMEYIEGDNLKQFIENKKAKGQLIDEKIIYQIILQICMGLQKIHENKIIHRDLTPDNIFIDKKYQIKIGDFGVSKILTQTKKYTQTAIGKLQYIAPEIIIGEKYDIKVDIYSLGCIIYELFTLNEYYKDKLQEKSCKIDTDVYNPKWQDLIDSLLNKDSHKRPNINEIIKKIESLKSKIEITVRVDEMDINKEIYFLNNIKNLISEGKKYHDLSQDMNDSNTNLFINEKTYQFKNYFVPKEKGLFTIKLELYSSLNDCSYMFYNCQNIEFINLYSFNTENVTNMEYMFRGCERLENIVLKSFNTENVKDMKCMFSQCLKLKNLDLSTFETKNVTNMEFMFKSCVALTSLNLTSFDTSEVINMDFMFNNCTNLKSIELSSSFNTKNVTSMNNMFSKCRNLESLDLSKSKFDTQNVTDMFSMFSGCEKLEKLDLSSLNTTKVTNMEHMFSYCFNLENIDLSKFNTKNVDNMHSMFFGCYKIENIDLSLFDDRNVKNMDDMFDDCISLKEIKVNKNSFKNIPDNNRLIYI